MSTSPFKFYSAQGAGEQYGNRSNYSQAVLLPNGTLKLSGQGGWDPETGEIAADDEGKQIQLAFENVERHLSAFGYSWADVYQVRGYHVDLKGAGAGALVEALGERFGEGKRPILTVVEVKGLYSSMRIEIEIEAWKAPTA